MKETGLTGRKMGLANISFGKEMFTREILETIKNKEKDRSNIQTEVTLKESGIMIKFREEEPCYFRMETNLMETSKILKSTDSELTNFPIMMFIKDHLSTTSLMVKEN